MAQGVARVFGLVATLPGALVVAAGLIFGAGAWLQGEVEAERDMLRQALAGAPPPTVAVEAFSASDHVGLADEVQVTAQIDLSMAQPVSVAGKTGEETAWMVPLLPTDAAPVEARYGEVLAHMRSIGLVLPEAELRRRARAVAMPRALGVALIPADASGDGPAVAPETLARGALGQGYHGPIVVLNGTLGDEVPFRPAVAAAFDTVGRGLASGFITIEPYVGGRAAALERRLAGVQDLGHVFYMVAGGLVIFAGLHGLMRRRRRTVPAAPLAETAPMAAAADPQEANTLPAASGEPLWKARMHERAR